jgi:hypothetical protein
MITGRLWHSDEQAINGLLAAVSTVLRKLAGRDLDTEAALEKTLAQAVDVFQKIDAAAQASQCELLKAELASAQQGINPYTLQKPATGRREMRRAVMLRIAQTLQAATSEERAAIRARLKEAREIVQQIMLSALQSGLLTRARLEAASTEADAAALWREFGQQDALLAIRKKVHLLIGVFDAQILCGDVLAELRAE